MLFVTLTLSLFPFLSCCSPRVPLDAKAGLENKRGLQAPLTPTLPLVMAYYPDWASFDPEKIDFNRFDWIDFAFAVPDSNFNLTWDDPAAPDMLRRLVTHAHAGNKKVKLSVGGWSGSGYVTALRHAQCSRFIARSHRYFSKAVSSSDSRQMFTHNILAVYNEYGVDGIDIDWEYPGQIGQSGNTVTPSDSANFLCFLMLLKSTLPPGARITAATQSQPFAGPDGNPMSDVSAFAGVLDWILLMNYDVWGCTYLLIPSYMQSYKPTPQLPLLRVLMLLCTTAATTLRNQRQML